MKKILCVVSMLMLFQSPALAQQLKILTEIAPPGNYKENGQLKGIGVEIVEEILKRNNENIKIQVKPWGRAYRELGCRPNVALFSTTRTTSRENLFKWVGPLFDQQWIFVVRKESNIEISNLEDAKRVKSIGTYEDDVRDQFLREQGFKNLNTVKRPEEFYKMLIGNQLDMIITSNTALRMYADLLGIPVNKFKVAYVLKTFQLYIAFSKQTSDEIVLKWHNVYQDLAEEGFVKRVNEKYLGK